MSKTETNRTRLLEAPVGRTLAGLTVPMIFGVLSMVLYHLADTFFVGKPGSSYSQANKERLKWLAGENRLHPSIKNTVQSILSEEYRFPRDILREIKKDKLAWRNYERFSDSYKRIRIAYIDSARNRPEEFTRRLKSFVDRTRRNKMLGYGGIEKYY